ncbi:DUF1990 family protein [Rubrivirga sp. IMCC43871]|uniref:DUF1990 family protein n=1 Tax=Rubrivirga sp. IMCC43871 TaxID=3391575 RepID=UPI00398FDF5C
MGRLFSALAAAAGIAAGGAAGLAAWRRWGFRVRDDEREVAHVPDPPVADTPDGDRPIQPEEAGVGARFHRRYAVDVAESTRTPEALVAEIGRDIQAFVPDELAVFEKVKGAPERLAVGDEYDITIRSPWDGPVRVVEAEPTRFTLATLDGHMEAGQIRFEAHEHPSRPGALAFSIESWARSRDDVVDFVYDELGLAKKAQRAMWTFFCERVAEACGGHVIDEIRVLTEREAE